MRNAFARFRLDSLDIALGKKAMARFDRTAPQCNKHIDERFSALLHGHLRY